MKISEGLLIIRVLRSEADFLLEITCEGSVWRLLEIQLAYLV